MGEHDVRQNCTRVNIATNDYCIRTCDSREYYFHSAGSKRWRGASALRIVTIAVQGTRDKFMLFVHTSWGSHYNISVKLIYQRIYTEQAVVRELGPSVCISSTRSIAVVWVFQRQGPTPERSGDLVRARHSIQDSKRLLSAARLGRDDGGMEYPSVDVYELDLWLSHRSVDGIHRSVDGVSCPYSLKERHVSVGLGFPTFALVSRGINMHRVAT